MATAAPNTGAPTRARGIPDDISTLVTIKQRDAAPTRRAMLGLVAGAALAVPVAVAAAPSWSAHQWLARWSHLGCGARLDAQGHLQLTPRTGVETEAASMLAELAAAGRIIALKTALERSGLYDSCPALTAVEHCEQIDRECILSDEDQRGHDAWMARWERAERALARTPARTGRGLAAKVRYALNNGSDDSETLSAALGQLEQW